MQIIHTKDYVPACTSDLCGFTFNTHGPVSALMEHYERLEINMHCHTTESSYNFRTCRHMWQDNLQRDLAEKFNNGTKPAFVFSCVCAWQILGEMFAGINSLTSKRQFISR